MQNKTLQSVCYIAVEQLLYHTFSQIHVIRSTLEISGSTKGKMGSLSHCRAQSRDPVASSWPRECMKMYLILFQLKDRAKKAWPLWPVCLRYNRGPPCSVPRLSTPSTNTTRTCKRWSFTKRQISYGSVHSYELPIMGKFTSRFKAIWGWREGNRSYSWMITEFCWG